MNNYRTQYSSAALLLLIFAIGVSVDGPRNAAAPIRPGLEQPAGIHSGIEQNQPMSEPRSPLPVSRVASQDSEAVDYALREAFFDVVVRANLDINIWSWEDPAIRTAFARSQEISTAIALLQRHRDRQVEQGPVCPTLEALIRRDCPEAITPGDLDTWGMVARFDEFESDVLLHGDDAGSYPQEQGNAQSALQERLIEIDPFVKLVKPKSTVGTSADR